MSVKTLRACKTTESITANPKVSSRALDIIFALHDTQSTAIGNSRDKVGEVERTLLDDRDVLLRGNHL